MIPGVVVGLVEPVVIVGRGIDAAYKLGGVDGRHSLIGLGDEVVAILRIGIAGAHGGIVGAPAHGALGVEEALAADLTDRDLAQIIMGLQTGARQLLVDEGAAHAIDMHTREVGKSGAADERLGNLVDSALAHAYLRPSSLGQHGVGGIALAHRDHCRTLAATGGTTEGARLHIEHETDKQLVTASAEDHGAESDLQAGLAARGDDVLGDKGACAGLDIMGGKPVAGYVGSRHVDIFGIGYADGIDTVGIIAREGYGAGKGGGHAVYLDLLGGQIIKLLRPGCHSRRKKYHD